MTCEDFKKKVADLFDINVDAATKRECGQHLSQCPDCKAYYDGLAETYDALCLKDYETCPTVAEKRKNKP